MPTGVGALAQASVLLHTTWGQAFDGDGHSLIPLVGESFSDDPNLVEIPILEGTAVMRAPEIGAVAVPGTLQTILDYNNSDDLLQAAFGTVSSRNFSLQDDQDDLLAVRIDRTVSRVHLASAKVIGFEIAASGVDDFVQFNLDMVAEDLARSSDAFPALSFTNYGPVILKHCVFRLGDQANDLAGGDAMSISGFRLRVTRNSRTDIYGTTESGHDDAKYMFEPELNGLRTAELDITMPKYDIDTLLTWKAAGTKLQADFTFTDPDTSEECRIDIPEMLIKSGFNAETSGPGMREMSGTFGCYLNTSTTSMAGAGQSDVDYEVEITLT